jgi:hypothetical protein
MAGRLATSVWNCVSSPIERVGLEAEVHPMLHAQSSFRAATFASVLILGASALGPTSAWASRHGGGGRGGSDIEHDYNADHDGIYQVQRGDLVCNSRAACGGPAAIPMNRPGWFYLPGAGPIRR